LSVPLNPPVQDLVPEGRSSDFIEARAAEGVRRRGVGR
jgi:hypothetical protein